MMISALRVAPFMVVLMAGCVPAQQGGPIVSPPPQDGPNACGALDLQYLVGAPDTVLETMRFANPVRVISPGMAVTMDYNAERLNFMLDRYGMIRRVSCG
ncbi:MAG: hypothetical protein RIT14_2344 [Pseudomonadota bacterium]